MSDSNKAGWLGILFLAALGLAMGITAIARADAPTMADRIAALVPRYGSRSVELVDADEFGAAVASVPKVTREWAALIVTVAVHESGFSARIAANDCRKEECDGGLAFGLYQGHRNKHNESVWGSNDVTVQTLEAARALRSAFYVCNGRRPLPVDWVARTINGYAGRRCDARWPGLEQRLATFGRIVRAL